MDRGTPDCVVTPDLALQGTWQHWIQCGCDVSLSQATRIYSIDNYVFLGEHCRESEMAARDVGLLSHASPAREQGRQQ